MSAPSSPLRGAKGTKLEVGEYSPYFELDILTDHSNKLTKRMIAQDSPAGSGNNGVTITDDSESQLLYWPNAEVPYTNSTVIYHLI